MKKILLLLFTAVSISANSQQKIISNHLVTFSRDSVTNSKLKKSLTAFLSEANKGNFDTPYIDIEHYNKYEYFFQYFDEYSESRFYKDSMFYKPYLLKSYSYNKKEYYITLEFTGIYNNEVKTSMILELKAVPFNNSYRFYCLFDENTSSWNTKNIKGTTFLYTENLDEKKANLFIEFNQKLENLTGKKSDIYNYYKCKNTHKALEIFGIKYYFRHANSDYGFGLADDYGNFITGIDSEDYLHDYVHTFFGKIYDNNKTWREFEEGIAIYYGNNWGVPLAELKEILRSELKKDPNFDFLTEFKKGRKSKRYDGKHSYNRIMTGVLAKLIIEKKGFDTAIKLLYTGNKGESFFLVLNKEIGINEANFNKKMKQLLKN